MTGLQDNGDVDSAPSSDLRTAVLVLRVWVEPDTEGGLRGRLLTVDEGDGPTTWSTAAGVDAIGREVVRWLQAALARA